MTATTVLTSRHIDAMAPVSLDEIEAVAELQTRRDRKYVVPKATLDGVLADLGHGARVLEIDDGRSFRYESTYFDTPDLDSYLGAARRRPCRFKVRTRTYLDHDLCALEVKRRDRRGNTVKHRYPYDAVDRLRLTPAGARFAGSFREIGRHCETLQSTLTTSYCRATLLIGAPASRVTIDADVEWTDTDGRRASLLDQVIVETKTDSKPSLMDHLLWGAGHRPVAISKYGTGLAAVRGDVPANKWNRVLRRYFDWTPCIHPSN